MPAIRCSICSCKRFPKAINLHYFQSFYIQLHSSIEISSGWYYEHEGGSCWFFHTVWTCKESSRPIKSPTICKKLYFSTPSGDHSRADPELLHEILRRQTHTSACATNTSTQENHEGIAPLDLHTTNFMKRIPHQIHVEKKHMLIKHSQQRSTKDSLGFWWQLRVGL